MNTFFYHQFLASSELGGAGLIGIHIAEYLARTKRCCNIWVPGAGPAENAACLLNLPVRYYNIEYARSRSKWRTFMANWQVYRKLQNKNQGLVHVHGALYYGLLNLGLKFSGLKRVVHIHIEEGLTGLQWAFQSQPEMIITCAQFLVDHIRMALPIEKQNYQRIEAVPNAVDTKRFSPGDKATAKTSIDAPSMPLMVMVANIAPHKGQETAIRTVALLKQRGINLACWIAGLEREKKQTYTIQLQSLINELMVTDRVFLLGQRSDIPKLLQASDFFLLPSIREGLPLSILEAQACKVPVLAAPTAGIPEVIHNGETGFLIAADDVKGYADCLQALIEHPELSETIIDAAYNQIMMCHTWSAYCKRIDALYQEILYK
jgi:glycosyltransferase involved in cell wall biosynthesis